MEARTFTGPRPAVLAVTPAAVAPTLDGARSRAPSEVLSFRLGAEEYGIDILRVQEIRSYESCTRIAGAPEFILGVVNLRGVIVPVVDLRRKFALEGAQCTASTVTIVINVAQRVVGVVVDSVSDVLELSPEQVQPAPEFNHLVAAGHITGIGTVKQGDVQRTLILIDIEQLMSGADMGLVASAAA